jgi:asparagine synthase (glutamine-hydrolysing)
MCGIFALLNNRDTYPEELVREAFDTGRRRGPEKSTFKRVGDRVHFGFHRLAINGLTEISDQPMTIGNVTLVCNGEIYNYRELFDLMGIEPETGSDCEIIIHLYKKYGIKETLSLIDGVFAFVLYDYSNYRDPARVYVARDPLGVRPLYMLSANGPRFEDRDLDSVQVTHDDIYCFASELKPLQRLINAHGPMYYDSFRPNSLTRAQGLPLPPSTRGLLMAKQYPPGTYSSFNLPLGAHQAWVPTAMAVPYATLNISRSSLRTERETVGRSAYETAIWETLTEAVRKRVVGTTERGIACCLSGGLDSSLIAALVSRYYDGHLETYSIGMKGSDDLKCARTVATHIGSKHTEVILSEDEFWDAIPEVIEAIESYDTTTVRASVGNYLLGKYISTHSDAKVVFNGDGSDELTGGYLYMLAAPDSLEFNAECRRLLNDIHAFDVLRSDKSISSHGLEPRTPFLDKSFVAAYLNAPLSLRNPRHFAGSDHPEKYFLRSIVQKMDPTLLPSEILWRTKEAFSDGVSGTAGTWYQLIQKRVQSIEMQDFVLEEPSVNAPTTPEQRYYRQVFDSMYPGSATVVPYFWMPRFVDAVDSSARSLDIYRSATASSTVLDSIGTGAPTSEKF